MFDVPNYILMALILGEWAYVVFWTRTAGKRVISGIMNAVTNLRTGRGKNPPVPQQILNAAPEPSIPAGEAMGPEVLDTPMGKAYVSKLAAQLGLPEDFVREQAAGFLSDGSLPVGQPGGAVPFGAPPQGGGMGPLGGILSMLLGGEIGLNPAVKASEPIARKIFSEVASGARSASSSHGASYWG